MDIQLIAIAVAVIIIAVILLACFLFGTRERTFEDALAQQQGLGILLATGGGKATDKHKDKHKSHHDVGGTKKKVQQTKSGENVAVSLQGAQGGQKKEKGKEEKTIVKRQRSSASASTDEHNQEKQIVSSTGNGSSVGPEPAKTNEDAADVGSTKKKQEENEEQKATAKKGGKKTRRADLDDGEHVASLHENGDQRPMDEVDSNDISKGEHSISVSLDESAQHAQKKAQKKKQKSSGGKHHREDGDQISDKENVGAGDGNFKKVIVQGTAQRAPSKDKTPIMQNGTKASSLEDHNLDIIIDRLKTSSLTQAQVEYVLDALLNRQEQWSQGTQKADQTAALKKQLEEKEKALAQEAQLVATANQKLKELRHQLEAEKNRLVSTERSYHDQLNGHQRELQTAQQKVQELTAQCAQMSAQSRHAQDQLLSYRKMLEQTPNPTQIQQLRDENQRLKERLSRNDHDSHAISTEIQRLRQELTQRESQLHQSEQRYLQLQQTLSMHDNSQAQQSADYQQKLAAKDVAYAQLEQELANVRREWALLETSVRELRQQASAAAQQQPMERNVHLQELQKNPAAEDPNTSKAHVSSLEKKVTELEKSLKNTDQIQKEVVQLREQLESAKRDRDNVEKSASTESERCKALIKENKQAIKDLEKSKAELAQQLDRLAAADAQVAKLTAEVVELKASGSAKSNVTNRSAELEQTVKKLESELKQVKEERRDLEQKIQNLVQENQRLSQQAAIASVNGHSEGASADALKIQELSLTHLNKQLITKDGEITQLKQQLDQQRQKNGELRERNQKVVEAMNQLEKTSKEMTQKVETKYQNQLDEQEKLAKVALSKIIPDTKIPEKQSFAEWIKEVQRVSIDKVKPSNADKTVRVLATELAKGSKDGDQLKRQNAELRAEISRYQNALQETETLLKLLEECAAKQERIWSERVVRLEGDLAKAHTGHSVNLTSAPPKVQKETESQLVILRSTLEAAEKGGVSLKVELEQLRKDVENERHNGRELSSQVVKLRGMLKTGQDALKQEQDLVAQLQKQLKAFQASATTASPNDAKEGKGEQLLNDELHELRTKLDQRERQLEREMSINKQLNNKLASLGVAAPSATSVGSNGSV